MLRITPVRTFKRTVKAQLPSATTPDAHDEVSFVATFRALSRTEVAAIQEEAMARVKDGGIPDDRPFLEKILVGVEGVVDESGNAVPADVARAAIIEDISLCIATVATFNEQFAKAKQGN